ncbi:magnesium transporter, partial [Obelidium mucronatum]
WICGISLCYVGEVFNWLALGQTSASVVTPLNIVSVLVAGSLGAIFLGEEFNANQRKGYICIIAAVALILFISPKSGSSLGSTPDQVLEALSSYTFLSVFSGIFLIQTFLIYNALFRRTSIILLTSICSLFGAIVVMGGKIITSLLGSATLSSQSLYETPDGIPSLLILLTMVIGSVVIQEYFKQEALTRYSVSTFQPIFFAGFNTAAVLSSVVVFREFETWQGLFGFLVVFGVAIAIILVGSRMIQQVRVAEEIKKIQSSKEAFCIFFFFNSLIRHSYYCSFCGGNKYLTISEK